MDQPPPSPSADPGLPSSSDPGSSTGPDPGSSTGHRPGTKQAHALSFAGVADAYERARPGYPEDAVRWLVRGEQADVLELGAGTGKLTAGLTALGHRVVATDPLAPMLTHLAGRLPAVPVAQAVAEQIPLRSRSVDVVVSGQAFHWFDLPRALPEIARVLRPGGSVALVWNERDERIPWVRRLGRALGSQEQDTDPTQHLLASNLFGYVDTATFRFWQPLDRDRLRDLVRSRSHIALMSEPQREAVLREVDELYDGYGRGADGMLLPYVTRCFRAVVKEQQQPEVPVRDTPPPTDDTDGDTLLIDFA